MNGDILLVCKRIIKAKRPEEIFGILKTKDKMSELKKQFLSLSKFVNPDLNHVEKDKEILTEATRVLNDNFSVAKELISEGKYGSYEKDMTTFEVKGFFYELFPDIIEGDFCQIYFGKRSSDGSSENICLKFIRDIKDNALLLNESEILRTINHKSLPVYLDRFINTNDGRMVNVFKRIENSYDIYSVRKCFYDGLPERHSSWVLARLLSVLGHLHQNRVIHGSIEPGNILITPHNHNGYLIDFVLSIPEADKKDKEYIGVNDYSAPEIHKRVKPHPTADMYSLGRTIVYLLGGTGEDFPDGTNPKLVNFIKGFLVKDPTKRKYDAWKAWFELKELRDIIYSKSRKFEELKI